MTQPTTPEVSSALMELPEDVVEKMCEAMYPRWALHSRQFRRLSRIDRDIAKTELRAALKALSDSGFRICAESKRTDFTEQDVCDAVNVALEAAAQAVMDYSSDGRGNGLFALADIIRDIKYKPEKSIENPSPLSPALAVARNEGLINAATDFLKAAESDFCFEGIESDDDECVASGLDGYESAITFGHIRRLRDALSACHRNAKAIRALKT